MSNVYAATSLSTGTGSLKAIDGDDLADTDIAIALDGTTPRWYSLDDDSGLPESSPDVIAPTDNAGTKRWILCEQPMMPSLFDAYTILMATTNNTPVAITITEQTVIGRITGGAIKALSVAEMYTLLGLDTDLATFSLPASTTISAYGKTLTAAADAAAARVLLGSDDAAAYFFATNL